MTMTTTTRMTTTATMTTTTTVRRIKERSPELLAR
jgi:hypothetical protein